MRYNISGEYMKNNIDKKLWLRLFVSILIGISLVSLLFKSPLAVEIIVKPEATLLETVPIQIAVSRDFKDYSAESVSVEVFNRYNKDDKVKALIPAAEEGKYYLYMTPLYEGEYIINVEINDKGKKLYESKTFNVSQETIE